MSAGYSGTPLIKKLGIKAPMRVLFLNAPTDYTATLGDLPSGVMLMNHLEAPLDFIQFFSLSRSEYLEQLPQLKSALAFSGMLWVSWVKKSAKIPTDLNEDVIRNIALENGLVDVKVCAVDQTWSGLKLVYRLEDRPKP